MGDGVSRQKPEQRSDQAHARLGFDVCQLRTESPNSAGAHSATICMTSSSLRRSLRIVITCFTSSLRSSAMATRQLRHVGRRSRNSCGPRTRPPGPLAATCSEGSLAILGRRQRRRLEAGRHESRLPTNTGSSSPPFALRRMLAPSHHCARPRSTKALSATEPTVTRSSRTLLVPRLKYRGDRPSERRDRLGAGTRRREQSRVVLCPVRPVPPPAYTNGVLVRPSGPENGGVFRALP